jgi:hypothetical protein
VSPSKTLISSASYSRTSNFLPITFLRLTEEESSVML